MSRRTSIANSSADAGTIKREEVVVVGEQPTILATRRDSLSSSTTAATATAKRAREENDVDVAPTNDSFVNNSGAGADVLKDDDERAAKRARTSDIEPVVSSSSRALDSVSIAPSTTLSAITTDRADTDTSLTTGSGSPSTPSPSSSAGVPSSSLFPDAAPPQRSYYVSDTDFRGTEAAQVLLGPGGPAIQLVSPNDSHVRFHRKKCANRECTFPSGYADKPKSIYCSKRCQGREQNIRQGRIRPKPVQDGPISMSRVDTSRRFPGEKFPLIYPNQLLNQQLLASHQASSAMSPSSATLALMHPQLQAQVASAQAQAQTQAQAQAEAQAHAHAVAQAQTLVAQSQAALGNVVGSAMSSGALGMGMSYFPDPRIFSSLQGVDPLALNAFLVSQQHLWQQQQQHQQQQQQQQQQQLQQQLQQLSQLHLPQQRGDSPESASSMSSNFVNRQNAMLHSLSLSHPGLVQQSSAVGNSDNLLATLPQPTPGSNADNERGGNRGR